MFSLVLPNSINTHSCCVHNVQPSEYNTYADIEAVYQCLQTEYGVSQEDIILYGQSVGSGPTLHLASKLPRLRGVVLHSGILSGLRVLCHVKFSFCFDIYTVSTPFFIGVYLTWIYRMLDIYCLELEHTVSHVCGIASYYLKYKLECVESII